ncbi:MAG: DinB family protein [Bryobacteraceae bacterium]|nr:DinB family protein [Bryobacteraceae bacterium]
MSLAIELSNLFRRDLTRLLHEIEAFPGSAELWTVLPGVTNSAGNLALHLEGNLRDFIGRQLGRIPYARQREEEFRVPDSPPKDLVSRIAEVRDLIPQVVAELSEADLQATYPQEVFGAPISTQHFLVHLNGHLTYHLGQINYLRRILTAGTTC